MKSPFLLSIAKRLPASNARKFLVGLSAAVVCAMVMLFVVWAAYNMTAEPKYGDTPEYWALSKTLRVDSWRTVGYPFVLRVDSLVFSSASLRHAALYTFQTLIAVGAVGYFLFVLVHTTSAQSRRNRWLLMPGLVCLLVTAPLVAHFNFAVLSDSLAASFFLITVAAILWLLTGRVTAGTAIIAILGLVGSGLIRQDRLLELVSIAVVLAVWSLARHHQKLALVFGILVVVGGCVAGFNKMTQTADFGRPPVSLTFSIFDRTVRGRLAELLPQMPATIQQRITPQMARYWDQHENYWVTINSALNDSAGQIAMRDAAKVAIRYDAVGITKNIASSFIAYLVTPLAYAKESLLQPAAAGNYWTYWTNTRMAQAHPILTKIYQDSFWAAFFGMIAVVLVRFKRAWTIILRYRRPLAFLGLTVIITAAVHTLQSSTGFHIRFALPIFIIEVGVLVWLAGQCLFDTSAAESTSHK